MPWQHKNTKYNRYGEAPRGNPCANFSASKRCVVCWLGPCICKVALMPRLTSLQDWLGGGDTAMAGRLHLQDCPHAISATAVCHPEKKKLQWLGACICKIAHTPLLWHITRSTAKAAKMAAAGVGGGSGVTRWRRQKQRCCQ